MSFTIYTRFAIVSLLMVASFCGLAQNLTLSGKVVDKDTSEPLVFASVSIKGKPIGTIANFLGEFDFHFPAEYRNDILVISMIGYENYEAPVWSVLNTSPLVITLNKSITLLQEVVVTDSLDGSEIFRIALSRIDQNYPMHPFILDGFYRDIKKVGGTSIALLEAAVKIYDENYAEPRNKNKLRERVRLVEVRKSLGYENKFNTYFDQKNLLEDLLLHNNIRYRIEGSEELFTNMIRENDSYYNGHEIYVVKYSGPFNLKVYIDKTDYAIIHLEHHVDHTGDNLLRKKNLVSRFIGQKKVIDFRKYDNKMYLNYISVTSIEKWYDEQTNELKFETELLQHLLINDVHPNPTKEISTTEKMRNYGLQYQDYPYNKEFWAQYNVIKETPLDKKITEDLEKVAPLEKQFEVE
ncbi:MAG TPA: carboxypeptidase-like regulatory domain-containing protein [Ohtaekwangia sp.]